MYIYVVLLLVEYYYIMPFILYYFKYSIKIKKINFLIKNIYLY